MDILLLCWHVVKYMTQTAVSKLIIDMKNNSYEI